MEESALIAEFLESLNQRSQKHGMHIHHAFVDWYVEAEFGRSAEWKFCDDVSDGGIDAIVQRPMENPPICIIQSKFSEHVGRGKVGPRAYEELSKVVQAFRWHQECWKPWYGSVREDLRQQYWRARRQLEAVGDWRHEKRAFRLITTLNRRSDCECGGLASGSFIYANDILRLYQRYRTVATPVAPPLTLRVDDRLTYTDSKRRRKAFLFNATVIDFAEYLKTTDVARLVARNIRFGIGGKIGRAIKNTYESEPHDFWYLHNGLTIVCDSMSAGARSVTLINPSVVNGAQTLYAISAADAHDRAAMVTTRVIVRGVTKDEAIEDDHWLQHVIRGVNTQNRVKMHDFRANEPEQAELQHLFQDENVYYERKRGEWKTVRNEPRFRGFAKLSLPRLGMILSAVSDSDGAGVLRVKRGLETIFDERSYRPLFPSRSRVRHRFERIYLAYRSYQLLSTFGYQDGRQYRKQRHAFWNCLWLLHKGITDLPLFYTRANVRKLRERFDDIDSMTRGSAPVRRAIPRLTREVWRAFRKARRSDPERWSANNFFKSSHGNKSIGRLAMPKLRQELRKVGKFLIAP